jgi:hypothetical protein
MIFTAPVGRDRGQQNRENDSKGTLLHMIKTARVLKGLAVAAATSGLLLVGALSASATTATVGVEPVSTVPGNQVGIDGTCPYGEDPNTVVPTQAIYSDAFVGGYAQMLNGNPNGFGFTATVANVPTGEYNVRLTCGDGSVADTTVHVK